MKTKVILELREDIVKEGRKQERERTLKIIDEWGQYPCGWIDSGDNLCDKIDRKELKQKIQDKHE